MNTLGLVIQREYMTRVRKKSFIIMTLLMPLLMVALSFFPLWLSTLNDGNEKNIAIIDNTGLYQQLFESTDIYKFQIVSQADKEESQSRLGKELYAILHITDDLNKNPRAVSITSEKQAPQDLQQLVESTLSEKVTQQKLDELTQSENVNAEAVEQVRKIVEDGSKISIRTLRWGDDGNISESSTELATIIGMVFTILIYMFILMYGSMVMQSVLEEKKSRIVEVMVSSLKPVNLLIGKIVGVGLVGLTQIFIWAVLVGGLFMGLSMFFISPEQTSSAMSADMSGISDFDIQGMLSTVMSVNWFEIIVFFLIFFIGGYILYASIFAMFASAVDSDEDTTQFMTPITMLIMFAFFAGFYSVSNPDGPLAFWTSIIPFTAPIVMMVRIPFGIPLWEKLLSVVLLYGSFIGIAVVAAKIYRVGILMYGKKPSIKEMIKWLKYK